MTVCHVNLARGFRGGERQTERLIRALAALGVGQRLLVRAGSPLPSLLADVPDLEIRSLRWPFVLRPWHVRGCDLVHAHEAKAVHYAHAARRLGGPPYVLTRRVPRRPSAGLATLAAYGRSARVIAISAAIEEVMRSYVPHVPVVRIPSMTGGMRADPAGVQAIRDLFPGRRLLVNVAALVDRHKGQRVLLDAIRMLDRRDLQLCFVGEGTDRAALEAAAADLPSVHFAGFVTDVADWIVAAEVFVFPSREEGLGSTLLDAMELGRPVVASRTGGIPEVVRHGESGLLVPPEDPAALAAAIERLLDDPDLCARLVQGGRRHLRHFLPETVANRTLALYREVPAAPRSRTASST